MLICVFFCFILNKIYVLYYSRLMENKLFLGASVNRERSEVTLNRSKVC